MRIMRLSLRWLKRPCQKRARRNRKVECTLLGFYRSATKRAGGKGGQLTKYVLGYLAIYLKILGSLSKKAHRNTAHNGTYKRVQDSVVLMKVPSWGDEGICVGQ